MQGSENIDQSSIVMTSDEEMPEVNQDLDNNIFFVDQEEKRTIGNVLNPNGKNM